MSEQISENMAHKIFDANEQFNASGLCSRRERFISALKHFGLIKPSKLDEARKLLRKICDNNNPDDDYRRGFEDAAERFEAAIAEIMEERE